MKRNMIAKCILCALIAFAAMCGWADMPQPTYSYHALSRSAWERKMAKSGAERTHAEDIIGDKEIGEGKLHGHSGILAIISIVAVISVFARVYIRFRRQKSFIVADADNVGIPRAGGLLSPTAENTVREDTRPPANDTHIKSDQHNQATTVALLRAVLITGIALGPIAVGLWYFFGSEIVDMLGGVQIGIECTDDRGSDIGVERGGHIDITVEPKPGESYREYLERTRRLENDLCLACGTKLKHWYFQGRRSGCPKCDDLYRTCTKCGKEFFDPSKESGFGSSSDELCEECNRSHGFR